MYRMLNSIELQEGVYKNELLDILASLFSIRTSNNIIMQLAISNAKEQLDKLKYPARIEDMIIDKFLHSDFTVSFEDNDGILRVNLKFNYFVKASELYNVIQFFQSMDCKFLGLYSNMISFVKGEKK